MWDGVPKIDPDKSGWHLIRFFYKEPEFKNEWTDIALLWHPIRENFGQWEQHTPGQVINTIYSNHMTVMEDGASTPEYIGILNLAH